MQTPRERVELILHQLEQLPTLPAVAGRLLAVTTSAESCARDVVEILESDASLTAAILRMVRRADLGVDTQVIAVQRAVILLGFRAVRNAVLSMHIYRTLGVADDQGHLGTTRQELWKHCLAVACTAEMLAERAGKIVSTGEAFVCGLLHDIGKVGLDTCLPKSYARVVARVERGHTCVCDAERKLFGLDHAVAGKRLMTHWQLAPSIRECVWLHHQDPESLPSSVVNPQLVRLIHLADNLVRRQRIGFSGYGHVADVEACAARLGIDDAALADVVGHLPARMEPFCALVGLDDATGATLYVESLAKANTELGHVNEKLAETNRELELQAACFDALKSLTGLSGGACIADVCAAAARCVRTAIDTSGALTFVGEASSRCLHVGYTDQGDGNPATAVIEVSDGQNRDLLSAAVAVSLERKIAAAPEGCETIWQRCMGSPPHGAVWMLPFIKTDTLIGAVFFVADDGVVARWRRATTECHALSSAIEQAVVSAKARVESERMNEELLDLNRRLRAAQQELVQARSISMIAEMAAGAAHEINNPLSVISGRAQMGAASPETEDIQHSLAIIRDKAHEASQIVTDLMLFARPNPPEPASQPLAALLEHYCQRWRARFSLRADCLTLSAADAEATVYTDPNQLREILDSVITNAVEAGESETLRVQVNSPSRLTDETVRIVIEDNGVGMSPDVLDHAFDPFFIDSRISTAGACGSNQYATSARR
jgi:putative nucleotidyltransferase with HDIG domain